jgi:hypothetical protein
MELLFGVIVLVVLVLLGWLSVSMVRSLRARRVGWPWWAAFFGCLVIGFVSGVWFGWCFKYQSEPTLRVIGFPLPSAIFVQKIDADGVERWEDYPNGPDAILDVLLFSFVSVSFVWLANTLWRLVRKRRKMPMPKQAPT